MRDEASSAGAAPVRTSFAAWWALAVLFLFYTCSNLDRYVMPMLVQSIKADLKLTDTQMSLVLGPAFVFSYSLMGLPLGWIADRTSRRWTIFSGALVWGFSAAAGGFAQTFGQIFASRVGVGAGEAGLTPQAYSLLADNFPRRRLAIALAIYQSALKVGTALAYALVGYLLITANDLVRGVPFLHELRPWQLVLILTALPAAILAPLVLTVREPRREKVVRAAAEGAGPFVRQNLGVLLLLMFGFGSMASASNALTAWVPAYMERRFDWEPAQFGPWLSVLSILTALSLLFKGGIMDWLYSRGMKDAHVRFYSWLCIAAFPAVVALFWLPVPEAFLVVYGILQIVTLTFMVFLAPAVQLFTPAHLRGQISAAFLFAFAIIGATGPVLVGLITDHVLHDEEKIGVSMGIVLVVMVMCSITFLRLSLPRLRAVMEANDKG